MSLSHDQSGRTVMRFSALGMLVTTTLLTLGLDLSIGLLG